jgi:hypothetical protein
MADPLRQYIPTQAKMEAIAAGFERLGRVAREAADRLAEPFAAAARQMELLRWKQAEARREVHWRLQQEKNILRQQLDRDTSSFGRKRRWRRARGRRIEATAQEPRVITLKLGQAFGKSEALRQQLLQAQRRLRT